jgi:hypothetical protein
VGFFFAVKYGMRYCYDMRSATYDTTEANTELCAMWLPRVTYINDAQSQVVQ